MGAFYLSHRMGEFRLNTTEQDGGASDFEDICAIPDLAAGMLAEVDPAPNVPSLIVRIRGGYGRCRAGLQTQRA